jgi:hypothetical protein
VPVDKGYKRHILSTVIECYLLRSDGQTRQGQTLELTYNLRDCLLLCRPVAIGSGAAQRDRRRPGESFGNVGARCTSAI